MFIIYHIHSLTDTLYLRAAKLNRPDIFGRLALCGCNPLISDSQGMTATTVMERLIMKQPLLCAIINNVKPCAGSPSSLQAPPPEAMLIELPVAGHVPGERVHIDSTSAAQPDPTIPIFSEGDINWNEIRTIFETMIEERDEADDGVL